TNLFRARVRDRDRKCVAFIGAPRNNWRGFEPCSCSANFERRLFREGGICLVITNRRRGSRETVINSCQNGLLM
ncbi:hypothetical protein V1525DRAFT_320402, partial [Lipomyces kononenkoae]